MEELIYSTRRIVYEQWNASTPAGKHDFFFIIGSSYALMGIYAECLVKSWLLQRHIQRQGGHCQMVFGWLEFKDNLCSHVWVDVQTESRTVEYDPEVLTCNLMYDLKIDAHPRHRINPNSATDDDLEKFKSAYDQGWEALMSRLAIGDPVQYLLAKTLDDLSKIGQSKAIRITGDEYLTAESEDSGELRLLRSSNVIWPC